MFKRFRSVLVDNSSVFGNVLGVSDFVGNGSGLFVGNLDSLSISFNFSLEDLQSSRDIVEDLLGGFRSGTTQTLVGHHDMLGVKSILKIGVADLDATFDHVLLAGLEVIEVLSSSVELSDEGTNDVVSLSEGNVVVSDQVVGNFSSSREVLGGEFRHSAQVKLGALDKRREDFSDSVQDVEDSNGDFLILMEISVVSGVETLHHGEGSVSVTLDSAGSSSHEFQHTGVLLLGHHRGSHSETVIKSDGLEFV